MKTRFLAFAFIAVATLFASCKTVRTKNISAIDDRFVYQGRIDQTIPAAPDIIWQNSRVEIDFTGSILILEFKDVTGQAYFDATIDDQTAVVRAIHGSVPVPLKLGKGRHHLTLTKRSEANAGTARFMGIQIADSARALPATTKSYAGKLLFFGDSITAAACNEDGESDQWDDRSTHNANLGYAALTANALGADFRNISVSGMGISVGYTPPTFSEIWNRFRPRSNARLANTNSYQPDILFINLGENDDSYSKNQGNDFPATYASRYIAMVREMRKAYPNSKIVILRGGMFGGAQSERLLGPWQEVVESLEKEDANTYHFVFKHWSQQHPRVSDHQQMAQELTSWVKANNLL